MHILARVPGRLLPVGTVKDVNKLHTDINIGAMGRVGENQEVESHARVTVLKNKA